MGRIRRFACAAFLTALLLAVLATHVQFGFERVRVRLVASPRLVTDAALVLPVPEISGLAGQPAALILRAKGTGEPVAVTVKFDDAPVARVDLRGQEEIRVDTSAFMSVGREHRIAIDSDRPGWVLSYLEIANVHGHSDGLLGFVVVPPSRDVDRVLPLWMLVPLGAALFALAVIAEWPRRRIWRRLSFGVAAVVGVLFVLVLVADLGSQFKVLLSLKTFLIAATLVYFDAVRRAAIALWPYRRFAPHLFVGWMLLSGVATFYERGTGFTSLIAFGIQFEPSFTPALQSAPHKIDPNSGYDGQFYAQLALDPLLRDAATVKALDDAAYRSRRVLIPAIAHVMGAGRPAWILQAYALLNVVAWLALAWLLLRWLPPGTTYTTLAWMACMLSDGLLASVRRSLLDGPSLLFLVLGIIAVEKNRHWLAAAICGLSGTARETNVLGGAALAPPTGLKPAQLGRWVIQGALVVLPLVAWLWHLQTLGLEPSPGGRNFMMPLTG